MDDLILEKRYGDVNEEYAGLKKSKVCIIQAPYEGTLTYLKGAAKGPAAIIDASLNMELFDEELQTETYKIGIHTIPPLEFAPDETPENAIAKIKDITTEIFQLNKFPVLLGGEHTVTIGAVQAARANFNNLSVLHLDAHGDLRDEYSGSKYNHACVARRIQEFCPLVAAGIRSISKEEKDFLSSASQNVQLMTVYDILEKHDWKKETVRLLSDTVYVSIDLDTLDPSIMSSVGTPEPGGFGWYEFIDFLKIIAREKNIVGFDVVELSPHEGYVNPNFLAAKLIYRLLGYIFFNKKR